MQNWDQGHLVVLGLASVPLPCLPNLVLGKRRNPSPLKVSKNLLNSGISSKYGEMYEEAETKGA
jgi:hypothetical protein